MFRSVFIANRGAVARRIVRACRAVGCDSVAAYADIDGEAPHLGEATATARLPGYLAADTYLNQERLIDAALAAGADALHPGYGFLAESASFARAVAAAGIRFVGPQPEWMETMGEKTRARAKMAAAGFPVRPGSPLLKNAEEAAAAARELGLPVLLKPAAGGGGIGMTRVDAAAELPSAFATAKAQAEAAFGDGALYLEAWLDRSRHIEFQIVGDGEGCLGLLERDCSVQRRHQKVIEEAPAPAVDREQLAATEAAAVAALAGYEGLGTVETLLAEDGFGFLEMNTRLQVEHGVTEEVLGIDLVAAQLRIAAGATLAAAMPARVQATGHAVEARIYAEHPITLLPATGRLAVFRPPRMAGVRIETGYAEGQWVTPYFDPLLAKVIGTADTRAKAIGRTLLGVKAFAIDGVASNRQLLQDTLGSEPFIAGRLHTGLLDARAAGRRSAKPA